MKSKFFCVILLLLLPLLIAATAQPAVAAEPITVLVNGQPLALDVAPLIEAGRTLVPVRAIAERLGAIVDWDFVARRVKITHDTGEIVLIIDDATAYVNGTAKQLDAPARIVNGRTLVPARFISESLHAEVKWDEKSRTVLITTYVDAAIQSAALAQLENEVFWELNRRRANLSRPALRLVEELSQMARSHGAELAQTGEFTHISSRFGDTAARAAARGLTVHYEYLAVGLPDARAIADSLLKGEQGAHLLAAQAQFFGLGLFKSSAPGNADIYVVAELIEGAGFICGQRQQRLQTAELTLSGYAAPQAPLTLYLLNAEGGYISRYNYTLNTDDAGRFNFSAVLPQPGRYAAVVGLDSVVITYE